MRAAMNVLKNCIWLRIVICLVGLACGARPAFAQVITSITNNSGGLAGLAWVGLAGDQVTIWGNTFSAVSWVKFNEVISPSAGAPSASYITAVIPAGAASSTNIVRVRFQNGVEITSPQNFIVPPTGPYVRSFDPTTGNTGTQVTINGTRFTGVTSVRFNGITGTGLQKLSDAMIKVTAPAGVTSGPLTVLSNTFAHVTTSNFFVPPSFTSFSPASGRAGTNVTIRGANLDGATQVQFGALNAASFQNQSSTQIVAVVPNGAINGKISVFTPAGSFTTTSNFVVLPTVTGFNPTFGPVGTAVTITGANLNEGIGAGGAPVVKFGSVTATTVSNVSFNQLTAVVPNGATTSLISVTTTNGSGTNNSFFYLPPQITAFSPSNSLPGSTITISGVNFTDATTVSFNGVGASFTVSNNTTIGATVPGGFNTGPITVITPGGTTNTSSLASSNFFAVPFIGGFSPNFGLPGTNVTISGSSFLGTTAVQFQAAGGGATNAPILSVNNGQITTRVPTNAVSGPITVVAPAGSHTSGSSFFLQYANLFVTVTDSPDPVAVSNNLTYNIQVTHNGPAASTVSLTNILPPGVSFVSSTFGSTVSNVTTVNFGTMNVGTTSNVTIVARPNNAAVTITNFTHAFSGPPAIYAPVLTPTYVEPLRLLSIAIYSPSEVLLSWPTTLSNYTLQYKNSLVTNVPWVDVLTAPATNGGSNLISQPRSDAVRFFRLRN